MGTEEQERQIHNRIISGCQQKGAVGLTLSTSLAKFWILSGTGPWGLAHSPAVLDAAADMTRDVPRMEIVAAVSKTCEICLCDETRLIPLDDVFTRVTGLKRAAEAVRNITR